MINMVTCIFHRNILENYQEHFAYRVRDEIVFYVIYAASNELFSFNKAMDYSIVQKILPKMGGSGGEVLDILVELFNNLNNTKYKNDGYIEDAQVRIMESLCESSEYILSSEKIMYMIRRFLRDGFTTFWNIETEEVYFSIKGYKAATGYGESKSLTIIIEGKECVDDIYKCLYFKEYSNYEIVIERKNKTTIEFYHDNPNIRNKVTPTGRGGNILSGIINFRGDIGYSDLYVKVNGHTHMKIIIEVLPSKIDYKEDYEAILRDVNEEIYNLAYGFLSRTYLAAEINNKQ